MDTILDNFLTKNNEMNEVMQLYHSFQKNDNEFQNCFFNMFLLDYKVVFGDEPKNKLMFHLLAKYYHNDYFVRYNFINKVLRKSTAISFEEFPIEDSRADLVSINGKSVAYEIKTKYDNYEKLRKQINDYSKCFEYVYVVCPKECVEKISCYLPPYCGIYAYSGKHNITFKVIKKADLSPNLMPNIMVGLLRRNEIKHYFNLEEADDIIQAFSREKIYYMFKQILKKRFSDSWISLKDEASSLV